MTHDEELNKRLTPSEISRFDQLDAEIRELIGPLRKLWRSMNENQKNTTVWQILQRCDGDREFAAVIIGILEADCG